MSAFSERELGYLLSQRRLARLATVGADGTPHVVPVGWAYNEQLDVIEIGGRDFAESKKYRDVRRSGRAAVVLDDLADAVEEPRPIIPIRPDRVRSWGV